MVSPYRCECSEKSRKSGLFNVVAMNSSLRLSELPESMLVGMSLLGTGYKLYFKECALNVQWTLKVIFTQGVL